VEHGERVQRADDDAVAGDDDESGDPKNEEKVCQVVKSFPFSE